MIKYPSIEQFRRVVKEVGMTYPNQILPALTFKGTVKVHGTNASVVIKPDGTITTQSRNNVITVDKDNAGFANWAEERKSWFHEYRSILEEELIINDSDTVVICGEFAGGNIQKNVAITGLNKFFYIFGIRIINEPENKDYWSYEIPKFERSNDIEFDRIFMSDTIWAKNIVINFNNPEESQNELIKITNDIEANCPVGKFLGGTESTVGEGVVWEHITSNGDMWSFKVKGEKHSSSKVKVMAAVDVEKMASIDEFVDYVLTESRLEQGFTEICNNEADRKFLGAFIKWVCSDVFKEETDTLVASGLTTKEVSSKLSKTVKNWFFAKELL